MPDSVDCKVDVVIELPRSVSFEEAVRIIMNKYGGRQDPSPLPIRRVTEDGGVVYPTLIFHGSGDTADMYYAIDPDVPYIGSPLQTRKIILVPRKDGVPTPDFTPESVEELKAELAGLR